MQTKILNQKWASYKAGSVMLAQNKNIIWPKVGERSKQKMEEVGNFVFPLLLPTIGS